MKIWITGINGLLGGAIAEQLEKNGHEVRGNDNYLCSLDAPKIKGNILNIDCCDFYNLKSAILQFEPETIVHCAAIASEGLSVFSPHFVTKNVAEASVSTFSAAISSNVKRIVYFSSMARYGHGKPPFTEEDITAPVDCYGIAKVYAEQQLKMLCETHGVKWSIVVPHNCISVRQEISAYRNVITIFLNRLKLGLPVYIYGDGEQKRCFSPVKDCLPSLLKIIDGEADGEVINIGPDGGEISINNILTMCEEVTGIKANRIYMPPRPVTDTVKEAYCSSDKARRLLGFEPQQSLIDCIQEMSDHLNPKPFNYSFPLEIKKGCPRTWLEKL